jgi:hypothetical protein
MHIEAARSNAHEVIREKTVIVPKTQACIIKIKLFEMFLT